MAKIGRPKAYVPHDKGISVYDIDDTQMFSAIQASRLLGVSKNTVRNWMESGAMGWVAAGKQRRIPGYEIKRFVLRTKRDSAFIAYNGPKYPWMPRIIQMMVDTKCNRPEIVSHAMRYGLMPPVPGDMDDLWNALLASAPISVRQKLTSFSSEPPNLSNPEFKKWVDDVGIMDLYRHPILPCLNILEDSSQKRLDIEVLLCGKVTYKEIVDIMKKKHSFEVTEDQLDFYARFFFNTYTFSVLDTQTYFSRIQNPMEARLKREAWCMPDNARMAVDAPISPDQRTVINRVLASSFRNFCEYENRGPEGLEIANKAASIMLSCVNALSKVEKAEAEKIAAAKAEASKQAEGAQSRVSQPTEEPVDIDDLDQPEDVASDGNEAEEAKVG